MSDVRVTIRLDFDNDRQLGHGKVRLLELIDAHGSISSAARAMNMSYRRAWLLVGEVNAMFADAVVETQLGGKGGGRARLTEFGRRVIDLYRAIEQDAGAGFEGQIAGLQARLTQPPPAEGG